MSGVDERETPLESDQPVGEEQAAAGDGGTGWPTTPAEIPLDGPTEPVAATEGPPVHPARHSRNPVDRLTRGLPDPVRVVVDWAVTIIGAQSLCLFLTLLLVPAAYVKLDALEQSLANRRLSTWLSKVRVFGPGRRAGTEGVAN